MGCRLKREEEELRRTLHAQGFSNTDIAHKVGVSSDVISHWVASRDLIPNPSSKTRARALKKQRRIRLITQGVPFEKIAQMEGIKVKTLQGWWREIKFHPRPRKISLKPSGIRVSNKPKQERDLLRRFFTDLLITSQQCRGKPDIGGFMSVWREINKSPEI